MEKIKFEVSMNLEEMKAGNSYPVEIDVERPEGIPDIVWQFAVANYRVKLQAQIRPNWGKFKEDTFPKTLQFGESLYSKGRVQRTPQEMAESMNRDEKLALIELLQKSM